MNPFDRRQPRPAAMTVHIGSRALNPALDASRRRLRLVNPNTPIKITITDGTYTAVCDNITPLLVAKTRHTGFDAGYHLAWLQKKAEYAFYGLEELATQMWRDTHGDLDGWWETNPTNPDCIIRRYENRLETSTDFELLHEQVRTVLPELIPWLLNMPVDV